MTGSQKEGDLLSLAVSFLSLDFLRFGVLGWLLVCRWASLLVKHSGCLLHLDQNLLSLDGGFLNFVLDLGLFVEELLGFSELDLLDGLLNFGDMVFELFSFGVIKVMICKNMLTDLVGAENVN